MEKKEDLRVETNMTDGELIGMMCYMHPQMNVVAGWRSLANRSIRRAIEDQQVVPIEEVQEVAKQLAKQQHSTFQRDQAIAKAVRHRCYTMSQKAIGCLDLDAIIAEVK